MLAFGATCGSPLAWILCGWLTWRIPGRRFARVPLGIGGAVLLCGTLGAASAWQAEPGLMSSPGSQPPGTPSLAVVLLLYGFIGAAPLFAMGGLALILKRDPSRPVEERPERAARVADAGRRSLVRRRADGSGGLRDWFGAGLLALIGVGWIGFTVRTGNPVGVVVGAAFLLFAWLARPERAPPE